MENNQFDEQINKNADKQDKQDYIEKQNQGNNQFETSVNQFPLNSNQIVQYKQVFDRQSLQKKKVYLASLRSHNNLLFQKIKSLDKNLDIQMKSLQKNKYKGKLKGNTPRVIQNESTNLSNKFSELEKIKKQLQIKKTGIDSLQFLLSVKQQQLNNLSKIKKQIKILKKKIQNLNQIKQKSIKQDNLYHTQMLRIGKFDLYANQIHQLKKKIQQKNIRNKIKQTQFISHHIRNQSAKNIDITANNKTLIQQDQQLNTYKSQYQKIGKIIQNLKLKKTMLLNTMPKIHESQKQLVKLQQKYQKSLKLLLK